MKKFRGKKRYFRQLWERTDVHTCYIELDNEAWFDFWHTHFDFWGLGNKSLKFRREHIKAHIAFYNNLLVELETLNKPYQSWVSIDVNDAGQDAVYIPQILTVTITHIRIMILIGIAIFLICSKTL